jgi:hypothetical protein
MASERPQRLADAVGGELFAEDGDETDGVAGRGGPP